LNFWTAWSAPCKTELPILDKLQKQFRAQGLVVLGMNVGNDPSTVTFPTLHIKDDDELLKTLLTRLTADRQLIIPEKIQHHLLTHLPRTPNAYRQTIARLDHAALAAGNKVTLTLAKQIITEFFPQES